MSDKLVRGLQSRTAKRGRVLADLEASRTEGRAMLQFAAVIGVPRDVLAPARSMLGQLRRDIRAVAADQKLDRELLRNLHIVNAQQRPQRTPKLKVNNDPRFKPGDVVEILEGDSDFYKAGTKATLVYRDRGGDWRADFNEVGNAPGSYDTQCSGLWYIFPGKFKLAA